MNWKTELKLADLDGTTPIEITCKRYGLTRYDTPAQLLECLDFKNAYLDEVECSLHCANRFCGGGVRISLIYDDKTEGFVGGMA